MGAWRGREPASRPWGAGVGLNCKAALGRTLRLSPSGSPHKGTDGDATLTGQSGLRDPGAGEGRAGRLAGGCERASVRVSL